MKILSTRKIIVEIIEADLPDFSTFERTSNGHWRRDYNGTFEPVESMEEELEQAYQSYVRTQ